VNRPVEAHNLVVGDWRLFPRFGEVPRHDAHLLSDPEAPLLTAFFVVGILNSERDLLVHTIGLGRTAERGRYVETTGVRAAASAALSRGVMWSNDPIAGVDEGALACVCGDSGIVALATCSVQHVLSWR
jgi:hypothetical protein